jgi:transposase
LKMKGQGAIEHITKTWRVSKRTVMRIVSEDQRSNPQPVRPSGGKKLSDADQKQFAEYMAEFGPVLREDLPQILHEKYGVTVSAQTAHRYIVKHGIKHYATGRGPPIKEGDKPKRMRVATQLLKCLDKCVFIDESKLGRLHYKAPGYYGRAPGLYYSAEFPKGMRSDAVGAVSSRGVLPLWFPIGNMTGDKFARGLGHFLQQLRKEKDMTIVVMDNAAYHGVSAVRDVLETEGFSWLKLPPYSPDMNVIEHFWATLKHGLAKENYEEEFKNVKELDAAPQAIWLAIEVEPVFQDFKKALEAIANLVANTLEDDELIPISYIFRPRHF